MELAYDIGRCLAENCKIRDNCKRYIALKDNCVRMVISDFSCKEEGSKCKHFIAIQK